MRTTEPKPRRQLLPGQSEALLRELHLVGRDGKLQADTLRKLKQVNHLVQLLAPALADVGERHPRPVLLDAGAGNAYLGFILYELFLREGEAELWSVETRPDLVARARERAARLGFTRMRFVEAPLGALIGAPAEAPLADAAPPPTDAALPPSDAALPPAQSPGAADAVPARLHLVTALHACDTATDDALILAVRRGADHVAVVPCCQAEVAAQLKAAPDAAQAPWPLLWSHPLHRREAGAHLTNVIRALALEASGYQVTVTELTGWEHSLKNELILGRRVHREHRGARARLGELLAATGVRPKLVRQLLPDLLAAG
ncbi:MAG: SAM-dependent methyltransferase [Myxococcales bacterium]